MTTAEGIHVSFDELLTLREHSRALSYSVSGKTRNMLQGNRPSNTHGRGGAFDQIRNYIAGDDVRDIDWNVTARLGKPYIRVFNEEHESPLIVLVDQSSDMFFATRKQMKSVVAAKIATYMLWMADNRKRPAGAVIFGDNNHALYRPRSNQAHLYGILNQLVEFNQALSIDNQMSDRSFTLNDALLRLTKAASKDTFVILISDFLQADEQSWQLIENLRLHTNLIASPIYDGAAENLPSEGHFLARYSDLQAELDFSTQYSRHKINQGVQGRIENLKQRFAELSVPALFFSTHDEVEKTLASGLFLEGEDHV